MQLKPIKMAGAMKDSGTPESPGSSLQLTLILRVSLVPGWKRFTRYPAPFVFAIA
jgi:hypothetical protein